MSAQQQSDWGRVAEDGTVFVKTSTGERAVGQYPEGSPEEALTFYTERFAALEFEVSLLVQRITGAKMSPDEATGSVKALRAQVAEANAVGDLDALGAKLDSVGPLIATQREARKAERTAKLAATRVEKEKLVAEAEKLAESNDWRDGANRLRELLDEWKALPRLDKADDDALWRRFSTARTAYTRRRKTHFSEQHEKRDTARAIKERLVVEAEKLSSSTEWGPTAGAFRDLMRDWKAAGPAPREFDEKLWRRFRGAQDAFFNNRDAVNAEMDREFAGNAEVKDALLVEAEALLPITDLEAAKKAFRDISAKWDEAGKVPRDRMKELDSRIRKVEQAIRGLEDAEWQRSDPEKSARANEMVVQLENGIADLEAKIAAAGGDAKKVKKLEDELASKRAFLQMAQNVSEEFSG